MLEKYEDLGTEININRPNLRTKKYTLKPNLGRLIVRVPTELKNADLFINGREIGEMGGKIAKGFQVDANVSLKVQAKQGDFESEIESVEVGPEETKKVEFTGFSDLRLVELRKQKEGEPYVKFCAKTLFPKSCLITIPAKKKKELRDRQDRYEAEIKRKEQTEKMKKLFKNTRVEIRTYGHLLDGAAYSLYFYFDPRFAIGYFHEKQNRESGPSATATYYDYDTTFKYRVEHAGYVFRLRSSLSGILGWRPPLNYLVDSWGISLFSGSGEATRQPSGLSTKINPIGMTLDYVWYLESGISLLLGGGLMKNNAEEDWTQWEDFEGTTVFSWGLLNIGYMF